MFDPSWEEGCKSCSFWVDNFDGIVVHLNHRDTSLVLVSRAPLAALDAYRRRMGWRVTWVSSFHTDFNRDYHVSFTPEELQGGRAYYNYAAWLQRHDQYEEVPLVRARGLSRPARAT